MPGLLQLVEARPPLHRTGVMQISAGQDGIQRLLKAEQEAQSIVTAARKGRADLKRELHQNKQVFVA